MRALSWGPYAMSPTEVKLPVGEFATGLQFLKLKIIAELD